MTDAPAPRQSARLPLAAAALLALAFGVAYLMGAFDGKAQVDLGKTVAGLRKDHADLFGDFELLDDRALSERRREAGGGLLAGEPHHKITTTRPTFIWKRPDGIERFDVALFDAQGQELWKRSAGHALLIFPTDVDPLASGSTYAWEVSGDAGQLTSRREFTVATDEERKRLRRAREACEDNLVLAHFAIRMGLLQHAKGLLLETRVASNVAPLWQKTRDYLSNQ